MHSRTGAVVAANDQGGRREAKPRAHAPQASTTWSKPEIRDDADRFHEFALAELGDVPSPRAEIEPEHEAPRAAPSRERRLPTGPLRQYDEAADPASAAGKLKTPLAPEPAPRGPAVMPPVTK